MLQLPAGTRVMLLLNLWTDVGLCNEAMGEVKSLIYKKNVIPSSSLIAVSVKFDNYSRLTFYNTDLFPKSLLSLTSGTVKNSKLQHAPLKLSWAVIIHKSREVTTQNTVADFRPTEKVAGLAYLALSRVKKLLDLMVEANFFKELKSQ